MTRKAVALNIQVKTFLKNKNKTNKKLETWEKECPTDSRQVNIYKLIN